MSLVTPGGKKIYLAEPQSNILAKNRKWSVDRSESFKWLIAVVGK
jgi:hypothetical protein